MKIIFVIYLLYIGKSKNIVFLTINGNLQYIEGGNGIKTLTFFLYSYILLSFHIYYCLIFLKD